jgi:DNA-binding GntR family transcriptional regulator
MHKISGRTRAVTNTDSDLIPGTRARAIAADLRKLILAGDYAPGERLRQSAIAERYGVSTTPVREAFGHLASEGLVRQDAHRGVEVFKPSLKELEEIYEIRLSLEPLTAELATKALTEDDLRALEELVSRMKAAKPADYPPLNQEFHRRIYEASGRPRVTDVIGSLREASASYTIMTVGHFDAAYHEQVQSEHEAILAALRSRAKRKVGSLVRKHLEHNWRHQSQVVTEDGS